MDDASKWQVIADQRRGLVELLSGLTAAEWESPSLCDRWRVRDVAAHVALASTHPGLGEMFVAVVRARGGFNRMNRDLAVAHAALPTEQLLADLLARAESHSKPVVTSLDNLHFDVIVHGQDVALPLGRTMEVPVEAARTGLERVWQMGWPFHARRRLRGLRLVATDAEWSAGAGPEVRGTALALLMLTTGRAAAAAPQLTGDGMPMLTPR